MSNPFLDEKAATANNPFVGLDDGIEPVRQGPALLSAQTYQPDAWADARRRGAQLGVAPDVVARNPDEVRKLELRQSVEQVRSTNPRLAEWLLSDDNLTLAQDDTESLGFIDGLLRDPITAVTDIPRAAVGGIGKMAGSTLSGIGEIPGLYVRGHDRLAAGIAGLFSDDAAARVSSNTKNIREMTPWFLRPDELARESIGRGGIGGAVEGFSDEVISPPEERQNLVTNVSAGVGQVAGYIGLTALTGGTGAVVAGAGQGIDIQADQLEAQGKLGTAGGDAAMTLGATITAVTERIGIGWLLRKMPKQVQQQFGRRVVDILMGAAGEAGQELSEGVLHNAVTMAFYDETQDLLGTSTQDATIGGIVGGLVRSAVHVGRARQRGSAENEKVNALSKMVQQSKLMERDPQKLSEFIAGAKQAGVENVYLPAEELTTLFQSSPEVVQAFEAAGIARDDIQESILARTDLKVPLETYLVDIAPKYHGQLGKSARLSPDSITDADPDAQDERDAAAERFLASIRDTPAEGEADMRVYNDVLGQLVGRYKQADAEQMAAVVNGFFRDGIGARAGIDPFEAYQRYGLRIVEEVERRVMGRVEPEFDSLVDRLRAGDIPTEADALGPTISEWLAEGRGIRSGKNEPMSGEIRRMAENDRFSRAGRRRLVREDDPEALTLDYAREAAVEAGFLPEGADINDLLDAIENDTRSEVNRDQSKSDLRDTLASLDEELGRRGIRLDEMTNEQVRKALFTPEGEASGEWASFDQSGTAEFDETQYRPAVTEWARTRFGDMIAPNGRPAWQNFVAWFGDSKVVDANGEPLVVFHGTGDNFDTFEHGSPNKKDGGWLGEGFYFSDSPEVSSRYAVDKPGDAPNVMPVFLSLKNPAYQEGLGVKDRLMLADLRGDKRKLREATEKLRAKGHDGIIWKPGYTNAPTEYVVFDPEQVKSATANAGNFDGGDASILNQSMAVDQTETEAFKKWSDGAPIITADESPTHEFKSGDKVVVEAFHGAKRPDRIGKGFNSKRATSGPMAYFTGSPLLASSYAQGKNDTSLAYEDQQYESWFKVKSPGSRSSVSIDRAWYSLTPEQKDTIAERAPQLTRDDDGNIIIEEGNTTGLGSYDYDLKQTQRGYDRRGNPLRALVESWLNGGTLFNEEDQFMRVLELAGFPMDQVTYDSPFAEYPSVFPVRIRMRNPLVTTDIPQNVVDALNAAAKRDRSRAKAGGADMWDKNNRTLREWVEAFNQGADDTAYVWTSIPDKVTDVFRSMGYDGIIDMGGKGGGDKHRVYIPFGEGQVKGRFNSGKYDESTPSKARDLLAQDVGDVRRGFIQFGKDRQFTIGLTQARDLSTFLHEFGHFSLEVFGDIAADSEAPQAIRDDYAALLKWLGVESREQIKTEHHEQFARGFEKYLAEGNPPSPELAGAFSRFRSWLKSIYKSLTNLNVELNDEVRGVMARMLAGDEAVVQAEQASVAEPLFKEASRAGMTEAQFAAYLELQAKAHDDAEARVTAEAYREVMREQERWWREESARVEGEVRAEFHALPVYRAWEALARNRNPDGTALDTPHVKLSADWLRERYGQEFMNKNLLRRQVYAADGGVHGDVIAPVFGFENGAALVEALANATPLSKAIRAETQARMRERHGDMRNDGTLPEKAMRAVHNTRRMKVIEAEIAALARLAGEPDMTTAQARKWAQERIAGKRVREITPYQYLRAERKAAREALRAANAGKPVEALAAARRKLANAVMYDEASKARDRFERRSKWIKQQTRKTTQERLGKAGVEYRDQVNGLLAVAGVREMSETEQARQKPLMAFVERLQEQGEDTAVTEAVLALSEAGRPVPMRDMTVGQFNDLHDALRNLKHLALNEGKLLASAERATVDQAVGAMVERAAESHPDRLPEMLSRRDETTARRVGDRLRRIASELDRPENIIESLDGGESGPWHDFLWGALNGAENTAIGLRRRMGTALRDLRKSMPDGFMRSLDATVELPHGIGQHSRGTLVGIVLNTGNAQNLQRLRDGGIHVNGEPITLTDDQVQELRDLLTPDEARYVQGLWDAVNSLWPDISALQTEMSGIPPEKVEAQAFTAAGHAMRGGYWPLAYDHSKSDIGERQSDDDALRMMMGQGFSRATTPKGHTKARVEKVNAPLQLDFGTVMSRHLENVMTDLAYRKAVKDASRLLRAPQVKDAIINRLGKGAYDTLKGSVAYAVSANDMAAQTAQSWRSVVSKVVSNSAVSALAIRPDIALGNYGSALVQALDRVGARSLLRGMWALNTGRRDLTAEISRLSPFMAERIGMIDEDYRAELTKAQGKRGYGEAYRRVAMTLHRWADHDVARAAWWGRYQESLDAGKPQAEAIRLADKTIRQTQTASARKDVSAIERDPAFRESRMFMGPMFVILGRLRSAAKGEGATRTAGLRAASIMRQMFLAPALFMLLAGRWPEDDDDDGEIGLGEWGVWLAVNTLLFPAQTIPYVREAAAGIEAWATDRPINPRAAPTAQAAAGLAKASKSIFQNIENYNDTGEFDWYDMTRDLTTMAGPFTGIPAGQTRITTQTIEAIQDDPDREKTELARMALYGPPKK